MRPQGKPEGGSNKVNRGSRAVVGVVASHRCLWAQTVNLNLDIGGVDQCSISTHTSFGIFAYIEETSAKDLDEFWDVR